MTTGPNLPPLSPSSPPSSPPSPSVPPPSFTPVSSSASRGGPAPVPPAPIEGFGSAAGGPATAPVAPVGLNHVTMEEAGVFSVKGRGRALAKLGLFVSILFVFGSVTTVLVTKSFTQNLSRTKRGVLLAADLKETVWQSFGTVTEAQLTLPIKTSSGEIVEQTFLLDTGAVVSSLPREMAEKLGFNLAFLPRQTFKGFGNTTSFAYQAEMNVVLGKKEVQLPVVFTEAGGSTALLGRKGVFDKFSIVVDHKNKVVEIKE